MQATLTATHGAHGARAAKWRASFFGFNVYINTQPVGSVMHMKVLNVICANTVYKFPFRKSNDPD
jgi:hypothetical protein